MNLQCSETCFGDPGSVFYVKKKPCLDLEVPTSCSGLRLAGEKEVRTADENFRRDHSHLQAETSSGCSITAASSIL